MGMVHVYVSGAILASTVTHHAKLYIKLLLECDEDLRVCTKGRKKFVHPRIVWMGIFDSFYMSSLLQLHVALQPPCSTYWSHSSTLQIHKAIFQTTVTHFCTKSKAVLDDKQK